MDLQDRWGEDKISCGYKGRFQPVGFLALFLLIFLFLSSVGSAEEKWINYTNASVVYALAFEGDYVWEGTWGGVIKRSLTNPEEDVTYYTRADGLAGNCVLSIAIDLMGNKWFGTTHGLSKFDGTYWTTYGCHNSKLPGQEVKFIAVSPDSAIWCVTQQLIPHRDVLSCFDGYVWKSYVASDTTFPGRFITALAVDNLGIIWIGTLDSQEPAGVTRFDGSNWITYNADNSGLLSNYVVDIAIDSVGNIWFAHGTRGHFHGAGISKFDGQTWEIFDKTNSGLFSDEVTSVCIDINNQVWIGTSDKGVFKFDGLNWSQFDTTNSALAFNSVQNIVADWQGDIWISFAAREFDTMDLGGVNRFDGQNWTFFESSNSGLWSNRISVIASDRGDTTWFVSENKVGKFYGTTWENYGEMGYVYDIAVDKKGVVWFSGDSKVIKYEKGNFVVYDTTNSSIPVDYISGHLVPILDIAVDADNIKWFTTSGGGLVRYDDIEWVVYNTSNSEIADNNLGPIAIDHQGNIWIGTHSKGLQKFDGGNWVLYDPYENPTFPQGLINRIVVDNHNNVWVSAVGYGLDLKGIGLYKWDGMRWIHYTNDNSGLPSNYIVDLGVDNNDNLWILTYEVYDFTHRFFGYATDLTVYDGIIWRSYNILNSGITENAHRVAFNSRDNILLATGNGIAILMRDGSNGLSPSLSVKTPRTFFLQQNYPNPFNEETTIRFYITGTGQRKWIELKVYNIKGELVQTLASGFLDAGWHEVKWNGENTRAPKVASGVYFYQLETDEYVDMRKLVLLR